MARLFRVGPGLVLVAGLAACTPPPPYETVSDPFAGAAGLPAAEPVQTRPLGSAGAPPRGAVTGPAGGVAAAEASGAFAAPSSGSRATPATGPGTGTGPVTGGATPDDTVTEVNPGGLVERLPNTCQLENYQQFVGQDGAGAAMQVVDRPARVIAPDDIVGQVYDPRRVNLYVDASGRVTRISCG
jgi:hypothetical protein